MKVSILFLGVAFLITVLSCTPSAEQKNEPSSKVTTENISEGKKAPAEVQADNMIRAKYNSAAVYAGSTDYEFIKEDGVSFFVRVIHEEDAENPKIPEGMLESGDDIEGPPGANPAMVGKYFKIEQSEMGKYLQVVLDPEN